MITSVRGILIESLPTRVAVEVHGVGYDILIPLSSFDRLPPVGQEVRLLTQLVIREDAHTLYGFSTAAERDLFRLLVDTVSGIGPKIALNILSGMSPSAFRSAVTSGDVRSLSQISGVGRKTAERIIVELKDRLGSLAAPPVPAPGIPGGSPTVPDADRALEDATLALIALGFKQTEALEAARAARAVLGSQASADQIVRGCLRKGTA